MSSGVSADADSQEAPDSTEKRLGGLRGCGRGYTSRPTFVKFGASRGHLRGNLIDDRRVVEHETAEGLRGNFQQF